MIWQSLPIRDQNTEILSTLGTACACATSGRPGGSGWPYRL